MNLPSPPKRPSSLGTAARSVLILPLCVALSAAPAPQALERPEDRALAEASGAAPALEASLPLPAPAVLSDLAPLPAFDIGEYDPAADEEAEGTLFEEIAEITLPDDAGIQPELADRFRKTRSSIPLQLTPPVVQYLKYFQGRGRQTIIATTYRAGAYSEMIERILDEEDVPQELIHLAQAETGFRHQARSWARATGLWQFVAFRGKQYGLQQDRYVDLRYDPESATRAAARHLKDLHIHFGDWNLAMAAYNSGPNRVESAIRRAGSRDFWALRKYLPRETRNYVPIIQAMTLIGKNLDWFNVSQEDVALPREYETVVTDSEIHLDLVADITGHDEKALRELNPALQRSATPPYRYQLRLPEGTAESFEQQIAQVPADKRIAWRRHRIKDGETLATVASKYKTSADKLMAVNSLGGPDVAEVEWLTIPQDPRVVRSYRSSGRAGGLVQSGSGRYRIARGDTLGGIARRFGVTVANLRAWNSLSSTRIRAGRYLIVRPNGGSTKTVSSKPPSNPLRYRVRRGDSLGKIAQRNGVSIRQLQVWNGLRGSRIYSGQTLIVGSKPSGQPTGGASTTPSRQDLAAAGPGQYRIRSGDSLITIAEKFGVSVTDLKRWNGLSSTRIRAGNLLVVRPPSSTTVAKATAPANAKTYKVRNGDTLGSIAQRHGATVTQIKQWNGLSSSRINVGKTLIVSGGSRPATRSVPASSDGSIRYVIRSGDTLGAIADRHGVTASDLRRWNNIRGSRIIRGNELKIFPKRNSAAAPAPAPARHSSTRYTVRSGETLGGIANRHGVTVTQLKSWNNLRSSSIRAGQSLLVAGPTAPAPRLASAGSRYRVQRGDTLGAIAQKHGISVTNLKRWNGIRGTRIIAGQYLNVSPPQSD